MRCLFLANSGGLIRKKNASQHCHGADSAACFSAALYWRRGESLENLPRKHLGRKMPSFCPNGISTHFGVQKSWPVGVDAVDPTSWDYLRGGTTPSQASASWSDHRNGCDMGVIFCYIFLKLMEFLRKTEIHLSLLPNF